MSNIENKAHTIRAIVTCIIICEYKLIKLVDNTHRDLKLRVRNCIASCRRVQDYFLNHPQATPETRATFKQEFLGDEIVLLSELLETCFGIKEEGLEEIIKAIKQNVETKPS